MFICQHKKKFFSLLNTIITGRNEVVAKVMFLQVCVCPQGGGCLPQCMLGCQTPPWDQADTPQDQEDPPWDQADPLRPGRPPREADSSIRSTSGRYASYWNAFLFAVKFKTLSGNTPEV